MKQHSAKMKKAPTIGLLVLIVTFNVVVVFSQTEGTTKAAVYSRKKVIAGLSDLPRLVAAEAAIEKEFSSAQARSKKQWADHEKRLEQFSKAQMQFDSYYQSKKDSDGVIRLTREEMRRYDKEKDEIKAQAVRLENETMTLSDADDKIAEEREKRRRELISPIHLEIENFIAAFSKQHNVIVIDEDLVLMSAENANVSSLLIAAYRDYLKTNQIRSNFTPPATKIARLDGKRLKRLMEEYPDRDIGVVLKSYVSNGGYNLVLDSSKSLPAALTSSKDVTEENLAPIERALKRVN